MIGPGGDMLGKGRQKREEGGRGGRGEIMAREGIKVEGERSGHALEGDSNSRVSFSQSLSQKSLSYARREEPIPGVYPFHNISLSSSHTYPLLRLLLLPPTITPTPFTISIRYMHLRQSIPPTCFSMLATSPIWQSIVNSATSSLRPVIGRSF